MSTGTQGANLVVIHNGEVSAHSPGPGTSLSNGRIRAEIVIVLGLSLGMSALYAIVNIVNRATRDVPLSQQTASINVSRDQREVFDLIYQVLGIAAALVPVALVIFLLWQPERPHLARLGIDGRRPWRDTRDGIGLAALIGIPGLFVYLGGRELGLTVTVVPTDLGAYWWTVPVLLLAALRAGILEEVIAVGYLFARLRELGWGPWSIILTSALLRGAYHLYQGVGAFFGNVAMGIIFGWLYQRYGRLMPLVIAHAALDAVIFVGYPWAAATFPGVFGVPE